MVEFADFNHGPMEPPMFEATWQRCRVGLLKKLPVLDSLGSGSGRGRDLNAGAAGAATTRVLCLRLAA